MNRLAAKSGASKSNSLISDSDVNYVKVKLTKDVLHAFEEQTRTSPLTLIQMYLERCTQEVGEIDGLITNGSSNGTSSGSSRTSSEEDDESEESGYDENEEDS